MNIKNTLFIAGFEQTSMLGQVQVNLYSNFFY